MSSDARPAGPRTIAWWWAIPIAIGIIVLTIAATLFLPHPTEADKAADGALYVTVRGIMWGGVAPVVVSLVIAVFLITVLRLWPRVIWDSVPTRRWVLIVPVLYAVPALAFADYGALAANGTDVLVAMLFYVLVIAVTEELIYRGLVLEVLRGGVSEPWAAVVSTLVFALAHFLGGATALPTVISALVGGYLYYLTRRATVFIGFPMLVHASFDVFGFSHMGDAGDAGLGMFLYQVVLFVVVLAMTRFVRPRDAATEA